MDALVPALIAALLAGIGDRPAWLAARVARKYRSRGFVFAAVIAAHAIAAAVAVAGAWLVAPLLSPNAKALLLALALILSGIGALLRSRPTREQRCVGAPTQALFDLVGAALGDRATMIAFALAVRGPQPILTGVGTVLGAAALGLAAIALGTEGWRALPLRSLSRTGGAILVAVGIAAGLSGFRLI